MLLANWYWVDMLQNTETHRLIFTTYRLYLSAYLTLSIGCDLYSQFHDTVEIPKSNKVIHLASLHCFFPSISGVSDSPVENVASSVCKLNKSTRIWDLFYWRFFPQIKINCNIILHYLLFYQQNNHFNQILNKKINASNSIAIAIWSHIWMKTAYGNHILTARL